MPYNTTVQQPSTSITIYSKEEGKKHEEKATTQYKKYIVFVEGVVGTGNRITI